MPVAGQDVVGRIEADPPQPRQIRLNPGMHRVLGRAIGAVAPMIEVAADVPAGDAQLPDQRDHDVREVLAHPLAHAQRVVGGRVDAGALRDVLERPVDARVDLAQQGERIAPPADIPLAGQLEQERRRTGEGAGHQRLPEVALSDLSIQGGPRSGIERVRESRRWAELDVRLRGDHQLAVADRDVERVDDVAQVVLVGETARLRLDAQRKIQAALHPLGARMQADLHDGLADRCMIAEAGDVPDAVFHVMCTQATMACSMG